MANYISYAIMIRRKTIRYTYEQSHEKYYIITSIKLVIEEIKYGITWCHVSVKFMF